MTRLLQLVGFVIAILAFAGLIYFLYLLATASDQVRLAALTAILSVGTIVYSHSLTSRREIASRQFSRKSDVYEEIMATISSLMNSTRKGEQVNDNKLIEEISAILPKLMVWAGPDVLLAWIRMSTPNGEPMAALQAGGHLITSLRKELGHLDDSSLGPLGALSALLKRDEKGQII